jgi:hypothetical protein
MGGGGGFGGGIPPSSGYIPPRVTNTPSYNTGGGSYTPPPSTSYTPPPVSTTYPTNRVTGGSTGTGAVPGVTTGTRPTSGGFTTPSTGGTGGVTWPTNGVTSTQPGGNSSLTAPITRPGNLFGAECALNVTVNAGVTTAVRPARYAWSVSVTSDTNNKAVRLSEAGDTAVKYSASVTRSDTRLPVYAVTGFITVTNPSTTQAMTASAIFAVLGDGQSGSSSSSSSSSSDPAADTVVARATCSQPFPLNIAAKGSVQCAFDLEVPGQQASQVSAVVLTDMGQRCLTQQGRAYTFAAGSSAPMQQPAAAASTVDDCTVLSIRYPRRDIAVSSIVLDQSVADEDDSSVSSATGRQNVSVLARRTLCKPAKFSFTANFKAQPGFLNCTEHLVRFLRCSSESAQWQMHWLPADATACT